MADLTASNLPVSSTSSQYWWKTTGRDLANMLHTANYPENTQHTFLEYYKNVLCPLLGNPINESDAMHAKSWTWDGSTHEYSFEIKGSTKALDVRFVADFSQLRPVNWNNPLSPACTEAVISSFASRAPGFNDTWYRALKAFLDCSYIPAEDQKELIAKAGHLSPLLIGFDILRTMPEGEGSSMLPIMGKVYFLPCIAAAAQRKTRFEVICAAIHQLPSISSRPNIISSLRMLEEYLASKPKDWENGARFLATDFLSPDKARLKVYFRCPESSFDSIWDYFTLGGRIPGLDTTQNQYRDFVKLLADSRSNSQPDCAHTRSIGVEVDTRNRYKLTTVYFSLDNRYPFPAPKIAFCTSNIATNDALVAQKLDQWLIKYGWNDGGISMEEHVSNAILHREMSEKPGIFTFIGLARKSPLHKGLSIQTYLCPELYESPRTIK
ncbi:aromatic prenyltransferase [Nemania sp. FL0916]|nr:aromatic prenyltransferase [Nemania sp. FL0916]